MKKEQTKDDSQDEDETKGSMTTREGTSKNFKMNDRSQATMDQMVQMNENEEDLEFNRPRSHSLPKVVYHEQDDQFDSDLDDSQDANMPQRSKYMFSLERNFAYEI
jgi:hypothetical protein